MVSRLCDDGVQGRDGRCVENSSCFQIFLFVPVCILLLGSPAGLIFCSDPLLLWGETVKPNLLHAAPLVTHRCYIYMVLNPSLAHTRPRVGVAAPSIGSASLSGTAVLQGAVRCAVCLDFPLRWGPKANQSQLISFCLIPCSIT